jgi:F-type H+-transporting ATPase subunit epsilon
MANLTHAELITPERVLFSGEAEAVVMRTDGGDITFLANHMDYIGAVDICVVRIQGVQQGGPRDATAPLGKEQSAESASGESVPTHEVRAAVHGGFVMVADNKVTIVAGVAELAEDIDVERAERALAAAEVAEAAGGDSTATGTAEVEEAILEGLPPAGSEAAAALAVARAKARLEAAAQLMGNLSRM